MAYMPKICDAFVLRDCMLWLIILSIKTFPPVTNPVECLKQHVFHSLINYSTLREITKKRGPHNHYVKCGNTVHHIIHNGCPRIFRCQRSILSWQRYYLTFWEWLNDERYFCFCKLNHVNIHLYFVKIEDLWRIAENWYTFFLNRYFIIGVTT